MNNETSRTHITAEDLKGARGLQVELFNSTFGGKAEITQRNMTIAFEVGLNVSRFEQLIPFPAQAEYKKAMASAWAEYEKVDDAAWDEYAKIVALAWAEYEKVKATALVVALTYDSVENAT